MSIFEAPYKDPHPFVYRPPTEDQIEKIQMIRGVIKDAYDIILRDLSASRERSLAITKLEESFMWASKSIVFND